MKAAIIAILAISALSGAAAQLAVNIMIYAYSDVLFTSCTTPVSSQVLNQYKVSNPIVARVDSCTKIYDNGMDLYVKYGGCNSDSTYLTYTLYNNAACTTCPGGECKKDFVTRDVCMAPSSTGFPGIKAFKITCSATNAGLAIVSLAAAALAWCL